MTLLSTLLGGNTRYRKVRREENDRSRVDELSEELLGVLCAQ